MRDYVDSPRFQRQSAEFLRKELSDVRHKLNVVRAEAECRETELERQVEMWKRKCLE